MGKSINLSEFLFEGTFRLVSISELSSLKPFDCGNQDLNDFLFHDAMKYEECLSFKTYVIESADRTVGYYSLANDRVSISANFDSDYKKKVKKLIKSNPRFQLFLDETIYPAVKIGRLAIDNSFQDCEIGSQIIDFLTYSFINKNKTGCQFITVDALNNIDTLRFYEDNNFSYLSINDVGKTTRTMYKFLLEYIK